MVKIKCKDKEKKTPKNHQQSIEIKHTYFYPNSHHIPKPNFLAPNPSYGSTITLTTRARFHFFQTSNRTAKNITSVFFHKSEKRPESRFPFVKVARKGGKLYPMHITLNDRFFWLYFFHLIFCDLMGIWWYFFSSFFFLDAKPSLFLFYDSIFSLAIKCINRKSFL